MGSGCSGLYSGTHGSSEKPLMVEKSPSLVIRPLFLNGRVTKRSLAEYRESFYGKSVIQINKMLEEEGYQTTIRKSTHSTSQAKIIVVINPDKDHNIMQVQVSPGSKRHGDVPYVKFSTTNLGIIKVINSTRAEYKTDGKEKATLIFKRRRKR